MQIVEILSRVFDLVRGSRAFVDETAHRFCIRGAQPGSLANLVVLVKARVAQRYEVLPAKSLAVEGRGNSLATISNTAFIYSRHIATQTILDLRARHHSRLGLETSNFVILVSSKRSGSAPEWI